MYGQQPPPNYTQMPQRPPMGPPGPPYQKKPIKRKNSTGRILLVLVIIGFTAWYVYSNVGPQGVQTAIVESGSIGSNYLGSALIVRNETAYDVDSVSSVQYTAEEGSTVYRGNEICTVYAAGYSKTQMDSLQGVRDEIKERMLILIQEDSNYDAEMQKVEDNVLNKAVEVRTVVQGLQNDAKKSNLINLETSLNLTIEQRSAYLEKKYSDDQRLIKLFEEEKARIRNMQGSINSQAAMYESIVSFYTDGYESLNTNGLEEFTPSQVSNMISGQRPEQTVSQRGKTTIYRLVRQGTWGVLMLIEEDSWVPVKGNTYQLKLEQFEDTVVEAKVISFTQAGGKLLVRMEVQSDVTPVLYMRTCQAEIGEYVSLLKVPRSCLTTQNGMNIVVTIRDGQNYYVEIDIKSRDATSAYIEPLQPGLLRVGDVLRVF